MNQSTIRKDFTKYVSSNIAGMLGLSCYILADTYFIANGVGENGLTALNLAIPAYSVMHAAGLMAGIGAATRFSISKSRTVFTQALYYILFLSAIFLTLGLCFSKPLALLLGADSYTITDTMVYLKVIYLFSPIFLLNNVLLAFIRNDNNPQLAMTGMILGSLSNIILDYVFIFPFRLGMFGAALATGIAPIISIMIQSTHFIKKKNSFHLNKTLPSVKTLADITSIGFASFLTEISSGIVIIVFNNLLLHTEGNTGVAAYGIIANIALVIISLFTGIAQGIQPLISQNFGKGNVFVTRQVLRYGIGTSVFIAIFVYAVTFPLAEPIAGLFMQEENLRLSQLAVQGMRIYFTTFLFSGFNIVCTAYFSSVDRPKKAFTISVLRGFLLIIPTAFLLCLLFGTSGIWVTMTVTEFLVFVIAVKNLKK